MIKYTIFLHCTLLKVLYFDRFDGVCVYVSNLSKWTLQVSNSCSTQF